MIDILARRNGVRCDRGDMTRGRRPPAKVSARSAAVDFAGIDAAALAASPRLLLHWLPNGRVMGREFVALNPRRNDRHLGSFRINLQTGRWADFATDDRGGDLISLVAFLDGCSQVDAARQLAAMLAIRGCAR
jgi:hypothetical protein